MINNAAQERLKGSTIVAIYDKAAPKMKQDDKFKFAGLNINSTVGKKAIYSKLTGAIDKSFNSVLQNYGYGFSGD
jgi:hypothetical protein